MSPKFSHKRIFFSILLLSFVLFLPSKCFADTYQNLLEAKSLAHYIMGITSDLYGMTSQAAYEYEQSLYYNPKNYAAHLRLGADLSRLGRLEDAADHLELVSVLNPDDMQSHYLLALVYSTQKKFDKAAREYETILHAFSETNPHNIEI